MSVQVTWSTHGNTLQIPVAADFSFHLCLQFLDRNARERLHQVTPGSLIKSIRGIMGPLLLQISAQQNFLTVRSLNRAFINEEQPMVVDYVTHLFDLDRDLDSFYSKMQADPFMKELVLPRRGLRLIGIPDLFEALCWSVIGQQINLNFAYTLKRRLVEAYAPALIWEGRRYWLFPTPQQVLKIPEESFRQWQFSRSKYSYLQVIAQAIADGKVNYEKLREMETGQAFERLMELKGIGPWSAQYVLMKCLRDPQAYPIQDVGLHNAIKNLQNRNSKPTRQELEALGKQWHPWQAYATFYLWHSLIV